MRRLALALMLLITACSGDYFEPVSLESDAPRSTAPIAPTTTELQTAPEGTVTVVVSGVEDAAGSQLAGMLFEGSWILNPSANGIGGFVVFVDSDPFSTNQVERPE